MSVGLLRILGVKNRPHAKVAENAGNLRDAAAKGAASGSSCQKKVAHAQSGISRVETWAAMKAT
jgi:hypothetical protein